MKCFTVQVIEIEGRIDSEYYRPAKIKFFRKLKESSNIIPLKEIMVENAYGVLPPGDCYSEDNDLLFLRATELKPDLKIDFASCLKIPTEYYRHVRARIKKNDILIAVKGATIASEKSVAIVKDDIRCIINGSIFRFQTNNSANPQYVAYILNSDLAKKQMRFNLVANNAVDYLNKSILENILIPLPSLEVQNKIVELMDEAYKTKKDKEQEAEELLNSINNYVLNELGIEIPKIEDKKCFSVNFEDIKHDRIDSFYHQPKFEIINKILCSGKYGIKNLVDITNKITDGTHHTPTYIEKGVKFISVKDVQKGKIDFRDSKFISGEEHKSLIKRSFPEPGDILLTKVGSIGRAAVIPKIEEEFSIFVSLALLKIKNEIVNSYYLESYLNSELAFRQFSRTLKGIGVPDLHLEEIKKLKIVLPPLKIQNKIANEVQNRTAKAEQLKNEALECLNLAKEKVEKIILG